MSVHPQYVRDHILEDVCDHSQCLCEVTLTILGCLCILSMCVCDHSQCLCEVTL
ncbi:hypothetical protein L208DRAFT_1405856, partial [Tricholoma matsutake]